MKFSEQKKPEYAKEVVKSALVTSITTVIDVTYRIPDNKQSII